MAEITETVRQQIVRFVIEAGHSRACIAARRDDPQRQAWRCCCDRDAILRSLKRPEEYRG